MQVADSLSQFHCVSTRYGFNGDEISCAAYDLEFGSE